MRNHTTPKIFDLAGPAGKTASLTMTASAGATATFNMNNLPTGKDKSMWYYTLAIVVEVIPSVTMASSAGAAINVDKLWKIVQSARVYSPILGELYSHTNTNGAALGLIQQQFGRGYNNDPRPIQIPSTNSAVVSPRLKYRIPFAFECLRKPHETSPWAGFLEGGQVEVKLDISTVLDADSTGTTVPSATVSCWLELIPSPEPVIHTPFHFRRHASLPGGTKRTTITDMGSPDGLKGTDQSKGVGLASLLYLTNATGMGLGGSTNQSADNITQIEIPWRDQTQTDNPEAFFEAFFAGMGVRPRADHAGVNEFGGFPYTLAATSTTGLLANSQALFFPLVAPGRDLETSKLQTVAGAKDLNFNYTTTPSAGPILLGHYFHTFSESFIQTDLVPRIAPGLKGVLRAKTLNKNMKSGVRGAGKLAYVRQKVVA